jgi:hypothetical protein
LALAMLGSAANVAAQAVPKARVWTDCDTVCLTLVESIKAQPDTLVMRLEDALVIRRECAGEIVSAALGAVGSSRALREQVVQTALKVAPEKSQAILYAARHPTRPAPVTAVDEDALAAAASPEVTVRRAIVPTEEVRRAEIPGTVASASPPQVRQPEVRRAIRLTEEPAVEVRPVEMARPGTPRLNLTQRRRR